MAIQQIDLPITGMTCANCARTVERTLKKTEGVGEANVNFATERAHVDYDPAQVNINEMIERIGLVNFLEGIGLEVDANMVSAPRTNPYVRTDGWDEEVAKIQAKKAAAA